MILLALIDAGAAFGTEVFRQFGEGADHIRDVTEMVTSMFVNLREHNNAVTSRLFHDFANFRIHEKVSLADKNGAC